MLPQHSWSEVYGLAPAGVCHADDLLYLWDPTFITFMDGSELEGEDREVGRMMVSAWAEFARSGDPTPPGTAVSWTPVQPLLNTLCSIEPNRVCEYSNITDFNTRMVRLIKFSVMIGYFKHSVLSR